MAALTDRLTVVLFVVCGVLLLSMGGAIFAAPLSLPLLYLGVRRHPTPAFRWTGGVLAALTAGEAAWAVVYVVAGEAEPVVWLVPLVAALGVLAAFVVIARPVAAAGGAARPS